MTNSRLRALSGVLAAGALIAGLAGSTAQAAESTTTAAVAEIGIRFNPDGDAGQCGGLAGEQWGRNPDFTRAIRFDTDNRSGGCQLSFGIFDPDNTLSGASVSYAFRATAGGDAGQCGNPGTFQMPIQRFKTFGSQVRVDTDGRPGGCNLTFAVSGRSDVILQVRYFADGDGGQCVNSLPSDQNHTAFAGSPVTIGIDTDGRSGGCQMQLRLQKV
ncbi:hypothetical protein [Streptomyces sp. AK08-02]|uniref:hypothetical protein n=1 Tax=Streptomyces sp. AK08-02 TaxID=3028654 RepID=UPI0029A36FED|nr:hypothetical protein [Streptomyces sp. AK08-02]MDX3752457.1 hypothetical protein [Streptomyces sp. AK08-02]